MKRKLNHILSNTRKMYIIDLAFRNYFSYYSLLVFRYFHKQQYPFSCLLFNLQYWPRKWFCVIKYMAMVSLSKATVTLQVVECNNHYWEFMYNILLKVLQYLIVFLLQRSHQRRWDTTDVIYFQNLLYQFH